MPSLCPQKHRSTRNEIKTMTPGRKSLVSWKKETAASARAIARALEKKSATLAKREAWLINPLTIALNADEN